MVYPFGVAAVFASSEKFVLLRKFSGVSSLLGWMEQVLSSTRFTILREVSVGEARTAEATEEAAAEAEKVMVVILVQFAVELRNQLVLQSGSTFVAAYQVQH